MVHPIFSKRANWLGYICALLVVSGIYFWLLYSFFGLDLYESFADSFSFNVCFFSFSLGLWYLAIFNDIRQQNTLYFIFNHLLAIFIFLSSWLGVSFAIVELFIGQDPSYYLFFDASVPWRFLFGLLMYLVVVLVCYSVIYYNSFKQKVKESAKLESLMKEAELNVLKSQINPHFLFNSLNSISSLTMASPEKAQEMIVNLSAFLRCTIGQDLKGKNRFEKELFNMQLYLSIERVRFGERLEIFMEVPDECLGAFVPNLILQPLYENAVKHGVNESTETVRVHTKAGMRGKNLEISIINNYAIDGVSRKGEGIGLKNIQDRMKLIYGRNDLFRIKKEEGLFEARLIFPQGI